MVSADLRDFGMEMFPTAKFACLLCGVARYYLPSEEVSKSDIKYLTHFILYTVRKSLGTDAEVNRLVKDLYNVDFQVARLRDQSELYSAIVEKKNGKRLAAISDGGSINSPTYYTSTQHLLALKIRRILVEMILSQQIKSPESLYPHVNKAVQALQDAFHGHRCVIGGEPINVVGAKDEYVVAPIHVEHEYGVEHGSASACLYNLRGTTSYMTATIQCLHRVPELKSALIKWHPLFETSSDHLLTAATRDLFKELDKNGEPVAPRVFLQLFEEKYPTLGPQDNHNPKDAEECWMQLLGTLSRSLKSSSENLDIVDVLFGIKLVSRVHFQGEKPPVEKTVLMLEWHVSSLVDHLHDGLRVFLESGLNKASPLCIGGLPRYLTIRFFRTKHRANYKINLLEVDVYKLCSNELRAKLKAAREGSSNQSGDSCKATCEEGQETQFTGVYDLITFLAHDKTPYHNRIKSPGHYAIYIKPEKIGRTLQWFNYVDENYFLIRQRYVKEIVRGGDGFVPYICLYKARIVN